MAEIKIFSFKRSYRTPPIYTPDEGKIKNMSSDIVSTRPRTPTGQRGLSCAAGWLARALKEGMARLIPPTVIAMVAGIIARRSFSAVGPVATSRDRAAVPGPKYRRCVVPGVGHNMASTPGNRDCA